MVFGKTIIYFFDLRINIPNYENINEILQFIIAENIMDKHMASTTERNAAFKHHKYETIYIYVLIEA